MLINKSLNAISLFSGALGLDLGIEESGFEIKLCLEFDKYACETIRINHPDIPLINSDIKIVSSEEILVTSGLKHGEVDLVFGGPPCQSFSTAGKRRALNDDKGNCIIQFIRVIRDLKPQYFLMENVRGILSAALLHRPLNQRGKDFPPLSDEEKPGSVLKFILKEFQLLGYQVNYKLLNAADYGVPQDRQRVVFLGSLDGKKIEFPEKTHHKKPKEDQLPWTSLGEVLLNMPKNISHHYSEYSNDRMNFMRLIPKGGGNWRNLPKDIQPQAMGGAFKSGGGKVGFFRRLWVDRPCPTLLTCPHQKATNLGHPYKDRPLSIEEYREIQQFPPNWVLAGNISEQYKQIGNAVPVGLSTVLGEAIIEHAVGKGKYKCESRVV